MITSWAPPSTLQITNWRKHENIALKKEFLKKGSVLFFFFQLLLQKKKKKEKAFPSSKNNQRGEAPPPPDLFSILQYCEPIMYTMASETGNMKITRTSEMSYHFTIYHYISP